MTGAGAVDLAALRSVHYQRPEVRGSTKRTTDHHDRHTVDVVEHFDDRVDVHAQGIQASRLLVPVGYCDHRGRRHVIVPNCLVTPGDPEYTDLLEVSGGAVTQSGAFTNNVQQSFTGGNPVLNLLSSHLRCAMFTNSITPNFDDTVANSCYGAGVYSANEVNNTDTSPYNLGYSPGGAGDGSSKGTFSAPSFNASNPLTFNASSAVWGSSTITNARCALIYVNSGLSQKSAICLITFGADYSTSAGTFTIQWSSSGIWQWTVH